MESKPQSLSVLHMVSSLNVGGAERFVIDLSQKQAAEGMKPEVFSFGDEYEPLYAECSNADLPVTVNQGRKLFALSRIVKKLIRMDIIHIHSPYVLKYITPVLPLLRSKKIIYTRHGADPLNNRIWNLIHGFSEKYINTVTFVSEDSQKIFHRRFGWTKPEQIVIDNAVLLPEPTNKVSDDCDVLKLGSVGRMVELKNQISLLQAVAELEPEEREKVHLHFFGDGPCMEGLKAFSEQYLSDCNIVFHGNVSDRENIYTSFELMVVTSQTEGLSMAIIEAMSSQCAVVATNVGGNPKLVQMNTTGWLFEYNDVKALSNIIRQCISDRDRMIEYAEVGKKLIDNNFSMDSCAKKYQKVYLNEPLSATTLIDGEQFENRYN